MFRIAHKPALSSAIVATVMIAVPGPVSAAHAFEYSNPTKPYYAESVLKQGTRTVNVKTWYSPDKVHLKVDSGGQIMALTADRRAKQMTMIMPGRKAYFVRPLPSGQYGPLGKTGPGKDMTFADVGTDTLLGVKTTKYKVSGKNAGGANFDGHIWLTADNIMLKLEGTQTRGERTSVIKMITKMLKVGPVDPKIFAIPEGYEKKGG